MRSEIFPRVKSDHGLKLIPVGGLPQRLPKRPKFPLWVDPVESCVGSKFGPFLLSSKHGGLLDLSCLLSHKKLSPIKRILMPNDEDLCQKKFQNRIENGRFGHFWAFLGQFSKLDSGPWGHTSQIFFALKWKIYVHSLCHKRFRSSILIHIWAMSDSKTTFYLKKDLQMVNFGPRFGQMWNDFFNFFCFSLKEYGLKVVIEKKIDWDSQRALRYGLSKKQKIS